MIRTAEEFIQLRSSTDPQVYERAATEAAPMEVWNKVIEHFPEFRFWVAQNKQVPHEILNLLATDADENVRLMVAMKRKLSPELLRRLAYDSDESVRAAVARHPHVPYDVLEMLASDSVDMVVESALRQLAEHSKDSAAPEPWSGVKEAGPEAEYK
jgi:hypothetical protein